MEINLNLLSEDVGLKFNNKVILGKNEVSNFIQNNHILFESWNLNPIDDSHMLYGYNKQGNPVKLGFDGDLIQRVIIVSKELDYQRFKVVAAYDGHRYSGFQIQKNQMTIQGELTKIISSVNAKETLVQGASRTDTGVHALNYVFHFDSDKNIDEDRWLELLNYQLPNDILIKSIKHVHPLFHSRYDVFKKRYVYKIRSNEKNPLKVNYEWFVKDLDRTKLTNSIADFVGKHDFISFCKGSPDDTVRTIFRAEAIYEDDNIKLVFEGSGFLRYMIRIMVYALVEIAKGKCELTISEILIEKNRNHTKHMAPAEGLYLDQIFY